MFEIWIAATVILIVAPLLLSLISFPGKKKLDAVTYKIRLRQSAVTLTLILLSTALNIIRSQTSIKLFSYIAAAVGIAATVYLILSHRSANKKSR